MKRPYIVCHMTMSIDGKATGSFLSLAQSEEAIQTCYQINRELKCNGFICGRVTMDESFTKGYYPDLCDYAPTSDTTDFIPADSLRGFYAVAFDTRGVLGWRGPLIEDEDEGYDKAQIIEVLSERADPRYLTYLKSLEIPYIFAGKNEIDINLALNKLQILFEIKKLLLEGGSIINGAFQRAGAVDELSLVISPVLADKNDKPLFMDGMAQGYELLNTKLYKNGAMWLNYKKIEGESK